MKNAGTYMISVMLSVLLVFVVIGSSAVVIADVCVNSESMKVLTEKTEEKTPEDYERIATLRSKACQLGEEVSELEALMESLEALKCRDALAAVREVAPLLGESYREGVLLYSRAPEPVPPSAADYPYVHRPVELLTALLHVFRSTEEKLPELTQITQAMPQRIVYSIRTKSRQILDRLALRNISLNELYAECRSRSELVATFISVLELCSIGSLFVSVSRRGDGYDLSFAGGDIDEILEQIEES